MQQTRPQQFTTITNDCLFYYTRKLQLQIALQHWSQTDEQKKQET